MRRQGHSNRFTNQEPIENENINNKKHDEIEKVEIKSYIIK